MNYRPAFDSGEFVRNDLHYFLPNEDGKAILYTYIRKNACSAFKRLMAEKSPDKTPGLKKFKQFRVPLDNVSFDEAIFVYRDPFDRAISAFLNKFVDKSGNADIFESFKSQTGKDPYTATFRDFTQYLDAPFKNLDPHVWPQKSHLLEVDYTLPLEMKELPATMAKKFPSISEAFQKPVNKSYKHETHTGDLCDIPVDQITSAGKENFEGLRDVLESIYETDMKMIKELKALRHKAA
ncbi:sulfotransferase family protein [Citreicella sp. C3M06]|uniref:sulfotransferase family 2 domain-containing protein n=1 Tax=Citreicella sp. C3M06 TaxID=2841564 RepID=UPI001C08A6FD|nr:sulfotransferase family 2 domain-containing protein [Citreicella sp. C3M06]MBU2963479.1 sulfotransferase family protein [Citreicella sp. C3M06]